MSQSSAARQALRSEAETLEAMSDDQLIEAFCDTDSQSFFEALWQRHQKRVAGRVYANVRSADDVDDVVQLVWMNLVNRLGHYQASGRFSHYLNRIVSNTIADFYRERYSRDLPLVSMSAPASGGSSDSESDGGDWDLPAPDIEQDQQCINQELLQLITDTLLPTLSDEHRLVLLMRHDFEYRVDQVALSWARLAQLNGLSEHEAQQAYERCRARVLCAQLSGEAPSYPVQELLIYLLWVQAMRPQQEKSMPWKSLADLLGVTENALKLRYRKALAELRQRLEQAYEG